MSLQVSNRIQSRFTKMNGIRALGLSSFLALSLLGNASFAQNVDVNDIDASDEGTTTIEIKKTKKLMKEPVAEATPGKSSDWEVQEGDAEVEGEMASLEFEARKEWKKACDSWKKEFREDNKENKIISMNCGKATCDGDVGKKTCTSKATYKIKSKLN